MMIQIRHNQSPLKKRGRGRPRIPQAVIAERAAAAAEKQKNKEKDKAERASKKQKK